MFLFSLSRDTLHLRLPEGRPIFFWVFGAGGRLPIWHGVGGFMFNSSSCTLHRAPVGQGPPGPDWLAISFGFWSGRALATGTAWAGLCLIHHHRPGFTARGLRGQGWSGWAVGKTAKKSKTDDGRCMGGVMRPRGNPSTIAPE